MNVLDLFCGIGGFSLGLHEAGMQTVAACEIDPWKRAQYRARFPGVPVFRDVRAVTAASLRGLAGIDIIAGSPPCQDASAANTRGQGIDGPETGLFREAVRLVRELRPRWVCFENVPRLRTRGYDRVALWMEEAGYSCWPLVVGADDIGANHERKRLWLIAHAADARQGHGELAWQGADANSVPRRPGAGRANGAKTCNGAACVSSDATSLGCGQGRQGRSDPSTAREQDEQLAWQTEVGNAAGEQVGRAGQSREDVLAHPWLGDLDRHIRAHDGVSARLAARLRHGYGDAVVVPLVTAIGRAILQAEAEAT